MPLVRVETIRGRSLAERKRLLDGVHDALVEAFGIPDDDRTQRMIEHDPENFEIPPGPASATRSSRSPRSPGDLQPRNGTSTRPWCATSERLAFLPATSRSFYTSRPWRTGASGAGNQPTKWTSASAWRSDSRPLIQI